MRVIRNEDEVNIGRIQLRRTIYLDDDGWSTVGEGPSDYQRGREIRAILEPCELKLEYIFDGDSVLGFNYSIVDGDRCGPEFSMEDLLAFLYNDVMEEIK